MKYAEFVAAPDDGVVVVVGVCDPIWRGNVDRQGREPDGQLAFIGAAHLNRFTFYLRLHSGTDHRKPFKIRNRNDSENWYYLYEEPNAPVVEIDHSSHKL